jgi:hypothetical protein
METENATWWSTWRDSVPAPWSKSTSCREMRGAVTNLSRRFLREVSLHVSGTGWRAYDHFIGQPIFYPGFSDNMISTVLAAPILRTRITDLADKRIAKEESQGLLDKKDPQYSLKRLHRQSTIEKSLEELSEKLVGEMICKFESKPFIRGAYYLTTQLLTRAYHQGKTIASIWRFWYNI